jgi:hypothetical protein
VIEQLVEAAVAAEPALVEGEASAGRSWPARDAEARRQAINAGELGTMIRRRAASGEHETAKTEVPAARFDPGTHAAVA